jgi:hypothetical protein
MMTDRADEAAAPDPATLMGAMGLHTSDPVTAKAGSKSVRKSLAERIGTPKGTPEAATGPLEGEVLPEGAVPLSAAPVDAGVPFDPATDGLGMIAGGWFDRLAAPDKVAEIGKMLDAIQPVADQPRGDTGKAGLSYEGGVLALSREAQALDAAGHAAEASQVYDLTRAWAATSDRFDPADFDSTWGSAGDREGGLTIGSVIYAARHYSYQPAGEAVDAAQATARADQAQTLVQAVDAALAGAEAKGGWGSNTLQVHAALDAIVAAQSGDATALPLIERISKATGVPKQDLGRALRDKQRQARVGDETEEVITEVDEPPEDQTPPDPAERARLETLAAPILTAPDILAHFVSEVHANNEYFGEDTALKLTLLNLSAICFNLGRGQITKGPSSNGKDGLAECVVRRQPDFLTVRMGSLSSTSLAYFTGPLRRRNLFFTEAASLADGSPEARDSKPVVDLRQLMSGGSVTHRATQMTEDERGRRKPVVVTYTRRGPVGVLLNTTAPDLYQELETRCLTVDLPASRKGTQGALVAIALRGGADVPENPPLFDPWRAFFTLCFWSGLECAPPIVLGLVLATHFPHMEVRAKRDIGAAIALIKCHALLHHRHRPRDPEGRVVATADDLVAVMNLLEPGFAGRGAMFPEGTLDLIDAMEAHEKARLAAAPPAPAATPPKGAVALPTPVQTPIGLRAIRDRLKWGTPRFDRVLGILVDQPDSGLEILRQVGLNSQLVRDKPWDAIRAVVKAGVSAFPQGATLGAAIAAAEKQQAALQAGAPKSGAA